MKLPYVGQFNAHQPKLPAANNPFNPIANGNDVPKPDLQVNANNANNANNNAAAPVPNDQQANQQQQIDNNVVANQNNNDNQNNNLQLQQEQKKQMISGSKLIKISSKNNMGLSAAAKVAHKSNQQKQDSGESNKFSQNNASKEKIEQQHSQNSFGNPAFVAAIKDKDSSMSQKDQGMAANSYGNEMGLQNQSKQQAAQSNNNSLEKKSQSSSKRLAGVAGMSHRSSARSRKSGRVGGIQTNKNQQDNGGFQEDGTQVKGGFLCCSSGTRTNAKADGQQEESGCTIF